MCGNLNLRPSWFSRLGGIRRSPSCVFFSVNFGGEEWTGEQSRAGGNCDTSKYAEDCAGMTSEL